MVNLDPALKQEYINLYKTCQIRPERVNEIDRYIDIIVQNKAKYKFVEKENHVPWYVVAAIHLLEASLKFNTHLHNGDPLNARTVHVPPGRPLHGNPPFTWEESAIDALEYDGLSNWHDWSTEGMCYRFEKYNGFGYRMHHPQVKSPYLWSYSNHYTKGKYASDGNFDPNLVSQQCGAMVLLKRMEERGLIGSIPPEPSQQVTWLELYRKELSVNASPIPVLAAWANDKLMQVLELPDRSIDDLVGFCGMYPNAKTFHIAVSNKPVPAPTTSLVIATNPLPNLTRILRWGDQGNDVKALQKALNHVGFNAGAEDGDFQDQTEAAVKAFQFKLGLLADGEVGPITWEKLGGKFDDGGIFNPADQPHLKLAVFAANEAAKKIRWNGASSEAEKYLKPLRPIMQQLNHIGSAPVFYDWCAAFVTYCCRQVGIQIPDKPDGFWASMALVASWEYWAKQKGYWYPGGQTKPMRGDIVTFDWSGVDGRFNHIGIVRGYTPGSFMVETAEGNARKESGHFSRNLSSVSGIIRIR